MQSGSGAGSANEVGTPGAVVPEQSPLPAARPGPSRRARAFDVASGIGSQLLNAGTNVATAYLASLFLRPDEFGLFALGFGFVSLFLATGRGLIGSTMLVHLPATEESDRPSLVRSAIGFSMVVGAIGAALLLVAAIWFPTLVWFAPWVVVALVQDVGRYVFLSCGRRGLALMLDATWAVTQLVFVLAFLTGGASLTIGVLATGWGVGALAGAIAFAVVTPSFARPANPHHWLRATRDVAGWFTALSVLGQIELYLVLVLAGTLLGAADAGGLRAVQLLAYQPVMVLLGSLLGLAIPPVARLGAASPRLPTVWLRTVLSVSPIALGALTVAALANPLMGMLFPQYIEYSSLVLPVALQSTAACLSMPTNALLSGTRRGALAFGLHSARTTAVVLLSCVGALVGGPAGLAWGLAAGGGVMFVMQTATAARILIRARRATTVPT